MWSSRSRVGPCSWISRRLLDEATVLAAVVGALNPTSQAPNGSREALLGLLAVSSPVLLVFDNCEHVLGPVSELLVDALGDERVAACAGDESGSG